MVLFPSPISPSGSNGQDFMFLLKGHEDLRQDERVMQLFGLVNTLLTNDPETFKRHLRWVWFVRTWRNRGLNVVVYITLFISMCKFVKPHFLLALYTCCTVYAGCF